MENNEIKIEKIPVQEMIDLLVALYNKGVDYIDIVGVPGNLHDKMAIAFTREYMTEEAMLNFDEIEVDEEIADEIDLNEKLSDEDLNKLI
jgi:hypothetical protein